MSRRSTIVNGQFLLDQFSGAAAAYSLRRLRNAYTGSCIRVRRSSDNAELDIGFTSTGVLDTAALLAHVGAGNGFVTTWYDQSGNGRNVTQATGGSQPRIVLAGVVDTDNGKPSVIFDGTDDSLEAQTLGDWIFLHSQTNTNFGVARAGNVVDPEALYVIWGTTITVLRNGAYLAHDTRSSNSADNRLQHVVGSTISPSIVVLNAQANGTTPANVQFMHYVLTQPTNATANQRSFLGTNSGALQNNNTNTATASTGNPNHPLILGTAKNASNVPFFFLAGAIQEQVYYANDQTSNRTAIENNIMKCYGI
jgi:hypothetical protein